MSNSIDKPRYLAGIFALAGCASLLFALHLYRPPRSGLWLETLYNSLHVPIFMVILVGVFGAIRQLTKFRQSYSLCLAVAITLVLGALSEAAQIRGPRDASFDDLLADWLGVISAALLILAFSGAIAAGGLRKLFLALTAIAVFATATWPFISVSAAFAERNSNVPLLFDFKARFHDSFMRMQNSTLQVRRLSDLDQDLGQVTLGSGAWPGIIFNDLWPDWSEYQAVIVDTYYDGAVDLEIHIRIHDKAHIASGQPYSDRFNLTYVLQKGRNEIRIPTERIRLAPRDRDMLLTEIHGLAIFSRRGQEGRSFGVIAIRLES